MTLARHMVVDESNNVVLAGAFGSSMKIDGISLTGTAANNSFLAKYSPAGSIIWAKAFAVDGFPPTANVVSSGLAAAKNSGFYFGGVVSSGTSTTGFSSKFDNEGTLVWTKTEPGVVTSYGRMGTLTVDAAGRLGVISRVGGYGTDGGAILAQTINSDAIELKRQSLATLGPNSGPEQLLTDADGNWYLVGRLSDWVDFSGVMLQSAGFLDLFVARFQADWSLAWAIPLGGAGTEGAFDAALDSVGNLYLSGVIQNVQDAAGELAGVTLTNGATASSFVAKIGRDGVVKWVKLPEATDWSLGASLSVSASGEVSTFVNYRGQLQAGPFSFQGLPLADSTAAARALLHYSTTGDLLGAFNLSPGFGPPGPGCIVRQNAFGHLTVCGSFSGTAQFGSAVLQAAGPQDVFTVQIRPFPAGPRLVIQHLDSGQTLIRWPAWASGSALQECEALTGTLDWRPVQATATKVGDEIIVTPALSPARMFFRLVTSSE